MKKKRVSYKEKASQLQKVIELAEQVITNSNVLTNKEKEAAIIWGKSIIEMANNPKPQFRKLASLKFLENDFLTYWNEAKGVDIELFWKKVYFNKLNFKRKDVIATVLKRKKIKDIHEYNVIVDTLLIAEQLGQIDNNEAKELSQMIEKFENYNDLNSKKTRDNHVR